MIHGYDKSNITERYTFFFKKKLADFIPERQPLLTVMPVGWPVTQL